MDERLSAAAGLFPTVRIGADIGANHGLLACHLLKTNKAQRMWITDLSADALKQARRNVQIQGLTERAAFAVGDGLTALPDPVDAAAILGMGGNTAAEIIESAPDERLPETLIVSTHTEHARVRRSLYRRGYEIHEEVVVYCGGRYYVLERAECSADAQMPDERTLFLGPCLMKTSSSTYRAYLDRKLAAYQPSRSPEGIRCYEWLREEAVRVFADSQSST